MTTTMQANIKKQLNAKNMSAAELERRTGIPHAVINILHGRSKNPSLKTAQAIAKELGCSLQELLEDEAAPPCSNKATWQPKIYKEAFEAVYNGIQNLGLQPEARQVAECITEVYTYTLGGNAQTVDPRFVAWLLNKSFS